jgi:hypothetical protein
VAGTIWVSDALVIYLYNGVADIPILGTTLTITAAQISDSTAAGRAMLTAANAAAQLVLLGIAQSTESALGIMRIVDAATIAAGTDDLEAVTTKKLNDSKYSPLGKESFLIPAVSLVPHTTPASAPTIASKATANGQIYKVLQFADGTTQYAGIAIPLPKKVDVAAAISARVRCSSNVVGGNVVWAVGIRAVGDGEAIDGAKGTEGSFVVPISLVNAVEVSTEVALGWSSGAAKEDTVFLQIYRHGVNASDTNTGIADLISVELIVSVDKGNNA